MPARRRGLSGRSGAAARDDYQLADRSALRCLHSARLPKGPDRQHGIPHAFGFLDRNIMRDAPPPSIPVFINVGVPPNQPSLRQMPRISAPRCSRARSRSLESDLRVALLASGGLTHFVVDEELDRRVLDAMRGGRRRRPRGRYPRSWFNGNSERDQELAAARLAAMQRARSKTMNLVDYVPCQHRGRHRPGHGLRVLG